jgi:hypothetical protein
VSALTDISEIGSGMLLHSAPMDRHALRRFGLRLVCIAWIGGAAWWALSPTYPATAQGEATCYQPLVPMLVQCALALCGVAWILRSFERGTTAEQVRRFWLVLGALATAWALAAFPLAALIGRGCDFSS